MCFVLYIGSDRPLPEIPWHEDRRAVYTESLNDHNQSVTRQFELPFVKYIGSSLSCGCGFRTAMFQDGGWPEAEYRGEDWFEAEDNEESPANHDNLASIVNGLLAENAVVELFGCWEGEEQHRCEKTLDINAKDLAYHNFVFRQRCKYRLIS